MIFKIRGIVKEILKEEEIEAETIEEAMDKYTDMWNEKAEDIETDEFSLEGFEINGEEYEMDDENSEEGEEESEERTD